MAVAPRADPADFFGPDEWRALIARSRWRGLWLVLHCWGVIGLAMVMGALWPATILLAVLVIGTRQLGLCILMHDGAHGLLHPNRRINDAVARWFCSSSLSEYRPYHLQHHRYVQQAEDPDLGLSAPFPISRASLKRKLWRDLSGQTFYKQRIAPLLAPPHKAAPTERQSQELVRGWRFVIGNAPGFAVFAAAGLWWVWHRLFTQVPCWKLPQAYALLRQRGITGRMEVQPGYATVLRLAAAG